MYLQARAKNTSRIILQDVTYIDTTDRKTTHKCLSITCNNQIVIKYSLKWWYLVSIVYTSRVYIPVLWFYNKRVWPPPSLEFNHSRSSICVCV